MIDKRRWVRRRTPDVLNLDNDKFDSNSNSYNNTKNNTGSSNNGSKKGPKRCTVSWALCMFFYILLIF
jgi:hypothetical protein